MKIELCKPLSVFARGRRENMEDCIFPVHGSALETDTLFLVCDGMGGHAKGEVASRLACDGFTEFIAQHPDAIISEGFFLDAFNHVQNLFDLFIESHAETGGMGTTLVMLYLYSGGAVIVHCGDSRFYHFRGHKLGWKTRDHNLVNEWVRQGLISEEEAAGHPRSNVITRAIQGNKASGVKPDIHFISEPETGDYFFLCTDGLYESINDGQLGEILSADISDEEKINIINELCEGNSRDNYSAYLIKIKNIVPD